MTSSANRPPELPEERCGRVPDPAVISSLVGCGRGTSRLASPRRGVERTAAFGPGLKRLTSPGISGHWG